LYFPEELIVFHHPRTAGLVVLQVDEPAIAELLAPAWQMLRNDMRMYVYFE
jgi:hypothetical protein